MKIVANKTNKLLIINHLKQSIMNAKRLFYLLLALPLLFTACKETPEPTPAPKPELKLVSEATVAFEAEGGAGTIVYELKNAVQGTALTATEDAAWISDVTVGETVTYFVEANESKEARTAKITLSYGTLAPIDVTINQAGAKENPTPAGTEYTMAFAMRIPSLELGYENNYVSLYLCDDAENVEFGLTLVGEEDAEILMPGTYTVADETIVLKDALLAVYEPATEYTITDATVTVAVTDEEEGIYSIEALLTTEEGDVKVVYEGVIMDMEPMPAPDPETIEPVSIFAEYMDEPGNFFLWIWVDEENEVYHALDMYDLVAPNANYLSEGHYSLEDGSIGDWSSWGLLKDGYAMSYGVTAAEIDLTINDDDTVL